VFAPAGSPREVMDLLRAVNLKVRSDPQFLQELDRAGAEVFTHPEPEKFLMEEVARWSQVIKATGFKMG
jgi:tripartite-type tricarboxylate transporter receptor subunit TctC